MESDKDVIKIKYKNKTVFIDKNLLYVVGNRKIPAFKDVELKIPFTFKPNLFSSKIGLLLGWIIFGG